MKTICDEFEAYGYRRVDAELRHRGIVVNAKKTRLAAFVTLRIAQSVCFGLQQSVQRLLHAPSHDPVEVVLDPLVVDRDDVVQRNLGHGGSFSLTWLRLATSSSAR